MAQGRIAIDPALLMSQSAEMTSLTEEFDALFGSVTTALGTMNSRWSANLSNNFVSKITSAKSAFSSLKELLQLGAKAAGISARDFLAVDQALGSAANSAAAGIKSGLDQIVGQAKILGEYWKGRSIPDILWEQLKRYKKIGDLGEDLDAIFGTSGIVGELPIAGMIGNIDKVLKLTELDDFTPGGITEKLNALYKLVGGKNLVMQETGLSSPEAGLVIDLVTAEAKNYAENTMENVNLIYQMLTDKDMSFSERLNTMSHVLNNNFQKAQLEGLRDVIYDKADDIGLIAGIQKYIEHASNGEFHSVSDVYRGYFATMSESVKQLGFVETVKINAESFVETLHEPWLGWKDFLSY